MSRVKVVQRTCLALVASLLAASCGTGTESALTTSSDGRNVALADDNGLPFPGITGYLDSVAIEPQTQGAWVSGGQITTGLVTGGVALYQSPKFVTIDPTFPRIDGIVNEIDYNSANSEIVIGGQFTAVGSRTGMQSRTGLAFVNPNGLREANISFNGEVNSLARIGSDIYVGGTSNQVRDRLTGQTQNTTGLHRIDTRTGQLLPQPQLEGIGDTTRVTDLAPGRLVSVDKIKMAVVAHNLDDDTKSLLIYNVVDGTMMKMMLQGIRSISLQTIDNGYALVRFDNPIPGSGSLYRILDIEAGSFIATYAPVGQVTLGAYGGEGRVRVLRLKNLALSLVDLDPRTLMPIKTTPLPDVQVPYINSAELTWAGADATLFANGALFFTATGEYQYLRTSTGDTLLVAKFISGRGLLMGGHFTTSIETRHSAPVRIPDEGRIYGVRDVGESIQFTRAMVSTPRGPVVMSHRDQLLLLGRDTSTSPTIIARFANPIWCRGFADLYSEGNSVFVSGCWNTFTVGADSTSDSIVEIDMSGDIPRIARTFATGDDIPEEIAVTQNHLFMSSHIGDLIAFSRTTGQEVGRRRHAGILNDLLGVRRNGIDVLLAGGTDLGMADTGNWRTPLMQLTVTDQSASQLRMSPSDFAVGNISSLAVDSANTDPAGPRYVYASGLNLRVGATWQSIVQLDFETGAPNPRLTFGANGTVFDVAVHGNRLWAVGFFNTVAVNNRVFRTSGVAAYNLDTYTLFERGIIPLVTTTTSPPTTVAGAATPSSDPAGVTTTTEPDDALTGPPIGPTPPPVLPDSGEATPGSYSVESNGVRSNVLVLDDGSIKITPDEATIAPNALVITKLVPGSRTVKVSWRSAPGKPVYKVTTGKGKGARTCTTSTTSCTVKNLDPWKAHAFVVQATKGKTRYISPASPRIKPHVSVKKGSSSKVSSIAPQGAKGKAKWTATSPCAVKNGKLLAPKKAGRCVLTVTVGKSTRKVAVRVG